MLFFVGTSGYSYKEWKGGFYPVRLPDRKMLEYYAQRFSTVEINSTFRRFPTSSTVESWAPGPTSKAILVDVLLLALFALQHSVMARPAFKRVWTRIIPEPIERSTYVLVSCAVTILLMWQWRGIDQVVWNAQHPMLRGFLWGLFVFGWLLIPLATLLINHFDLFGTRQVWFYLVAVNTNRYRFECHRYTSTCGIRSTSAG